MSGRCFLVGLLLMFGVCFPERILSQVDSSILAMADWVKAYNRFGKYNPQEKVYLHFDNTGYYLGETMWFAAYVVTAPQLRPTEMSKVLYVELLTPEGRIVETKKLKIEEGRCHGEFDLTSSLLVAGFYEVRAYTRVMLNWEGSYYTRVFPVFDRPEEAGQYAMKITRYPRSQRVPDERAAAPDYKSLNLSFYPEGGEMVEGLPGRVAFKAVDDEGRSVAVSGTVYDSDERPVATLETLHCGMGSFTLTPGAEPCRAEITYHGKTYRYTLPEAKAAGYTLGVDNSDRDSLHIKIRRSRDIEGGWVGLTVSCRGIAHAFEVADLRGREEAELHLSKADFPAGVQQITLFTPEGEVLGERLAYHQRDDQQLHITVDGQKSSYRPYEKITLPLHVTDAEGSPVATTLSVSVRDAGTEIPTHYASTLSTNLLLESDVKGYIEDIGYYFESDDAEHRAALDLLLLVQGWRRYEWRQQAGVEPFEPAHRVEEGIMVQGQVYDYRLRGARAKAGVELSVWAYSELTNSRGHCFTDSLGRFTFLSDSDIWGKNDLVIQTQITNKRGKKKNAPNLVELDRYFSPTARSLNVEETELAEKSLSAITYTDETYDLPDTLVSELPDSIKVHNLGEVEVKARKLMASQRPAIEYVVAEEVDKMIDTQVRDYADNIVDFLRRTNPYFLDRYMYVMDPITLRLKLIRDCFYRGRRVHFLLRDEVYKFCGDNWNSLNCVETIPLRSIERIQITENMDSVVIRLIPYPDDKYKYEKPGYRLTRLQGYSIPAEFYHADYSKGHLPDEADYRRTLYWNPALETDSLGRAYVDFYNNSHATRPRIEAETLTPDGLPGVYSSSNGF